MFKYLLLVAGLWLTSAVQSMDVKYRVTRSDSRKPHPAARSTAIASYIAAMPKTRTIKKGDVITAVIVHTIDLRDSVHSKVSR